MRVMTFDVGSINLGYACMEQGKVPASGSTRLKAPSEFQHIGLALQPFENRISTLLGEFSPDAVGIASLFVRQYRGRDSRYDTVENLLPLLSYSAFIAKLCADRRLPFHWVHERKARERLLGKGNVPAKGVDQKEAVFAKCRKLGWPCCDTEASDALCTSFHLLANLSDVGKN